jgi:hypothetical protein
MLRLRRPRMPHLLHRLRRALLRLHRRRAPQRLRHPRRMPHPRHRPRTRRRPLHLRRISRPRRQPPSVRRRRPRPPQHRRLPRRGLRWHRTQHLTQRLAHSRKCGLNNEARHPPVRRLPALPGSASTAMSRMPRPRRRMPLRQRRTPRLVHSHKYGPNNKCGPNKEARRPPAHRLPEPQESGSTCAMDRRAMQRRTLRRPRQTRLRAQRRTPCRRGPVPVDRARYHPVAPRHSHTMRRQPSPHRSRRCRPAPRP